MHPIKIKGSALLTALFIMTLVAIVATAMSVRLQSDIYRTQLVLFHDKLYLESQAVTFWGLNQLKNPQNFFSKIQKQGTVAQYPNNSITNSPLVLSGGLYDLQAQFNLNNLIDKKKAPFFINLINNIIPKIPEQESQKLLSDIIKWISPYDPGKGSDDTITYYLSQKPPYYPSHQFMESKSELRLVRNMNATTYLLLEPFITTLPENTAININTASKTILSALGDGLNQNQVNELITARSKMGITDLNTIGMLLTKLDIPKEQITIESTYFLSVASVSSKDSNLVVYSLIKRARDKNNKLTVRILRESIQTF